MPPRKKNNNNRPRTTQQGGNPLLFALLAPIVETAISRAVSGKNIITGRGAVGVKKTTRGKGQYVPGRRVRSGRGMKLPGR